MYRCVSLCWKLIFVLALMGGMACSSSEDDDSIGDGDQDRDLSVDGDRDSEEDGTDDRPEVEPAINLVGAEFAENAFRLYEYAERASWLARPSVWVDGVRLEAGQAGACAQEGGLPYWRLVCPLGEAGTLTFEAERIYGSSVSEHICPDCQAIKANRFMLKATFEASKSVTVSRLEFGGPLTMADATSWLSHGFQSWSSSGMLQLGPKPSDEDLQIALEKRGNDETRRRGTELSWFYTLVGGGKMSTFLGALTASVWKPWLQVYEEEDELKLFAHSGATAQVALSAGESIQSEIWMIAMSQYEQESLSRYGESLDARRLQRGADAAVAEAGWNSWYELWDDVTEQDVRDNAPLAKTILGPHLPSSVPLRIAIDDGWQKAWGDWTPNEKFPSGLNGLADDLIADGYKMGVWMAPLLVDEDLPLVTEHPDWFVEGAVFGHPDHGPMRVLDVTHPDAAAHLKSFISRVVGWGYDFLKLDFLFAGTYEGGRHETVTGMQAFTRALQLLREGAGDDTILLGVGVPPIPTIRYFDAWRVGTDIAFELTTPAWAFSVDQARSIAARWPICQAMLCDPDPPILRVMPQNEVEGGVWVVALAGGALFLSDYLPDLDPQRYAWGLDESTVEMSLTGTSATPEDIFPTEPPEYLSTSVEDGILGYNTHVIPTFWTLQDGRDLYLNPGEEPLDINGTTVPPHSVVVKP